MSTQELHFPTPILSQTRPATIGISASSILRLESTGHHQDGETKITVSSSNQTTLVGILNQKKPGESSSKVAIILHGVLAHKNQAYHRHLAARLPIDSFRFDFRGNAESGGEWKVDGIPNDVQDISDIVHFLEQEYGYEVDLVVAHSRGAMAAWNFFSASEEFRRGRHSHQIPYFVSLSARWDMSAAKQHDAAQQADLEEKGYFSWKIKIGGKVKEYRVTEEGLERYSRFPIRKIVESFPANIEVLVVHGSNDLSVPTKDAFGYVETLRSNPKRNIRSVDLHLVKGADHAYRNHRDEVAEYVSGWYEHKTKTKTSAPISKSVLPKL